MMHWQEIEWEQGGGGGGGGGGGRRGGAAEKFYFSIKSSCLIGHFIASQLHNFQSYHLHQHPLTMSKRTNADLRTDRISEDFEAVLTGCEDEH